MAIEDDLKTIEALQNQFFKDHGRYFEMDWSKHKIDIPAKDSVLDLKTITRFVGREDTLPQDTKQISFIPTAKDWRFMIGRGIRRDHTGDVVAECWYCLASQLDTEGKEVRRFIGGGDEKLLKSDGLKDLISG